MKTFGDGPTDKRYIDKMTSIMHVLDETFNGEDHGRDKKVGIVLWLFPYGDESGRSNYVSNGADRTDMIALMKEQIARFEGQPQMSGKA